MCFHNDFPPVFKIFLFSDKEKRNVYDRGGGMPGHSPSGHGPSFSSRGHFHPTMDPFDVFRHFFGGKDPFDPMFGGDPFNIFPQVSDFLFSMRKGYVLDGRMGTLGWGEVASPPF